jgi:ankyrin repeat protein
MYAIEYAPSYSLQMMKRVKGSIYERFKGGPTGLMIAAKAGNEAILEYYTDVPSGYLDFAGSDGNTALILAAEAGHESIVKTLIARGADQSLRNKAGKTALSLARLDSITEFLLYNV